MIIEFPKLNITIFKFLLSFSMNNFSMRSMIEGKKFCFWKNYSFSNNFKNYIW